MTALAFRDGLYTITLFLGVALNYWFFMSRYLESRVCGGVSFLLSLLYSAAVTLLFPHVPAVVRSFSAPLGTLLLALALYRGSFFRKLKTVAAYQICVLFLDAAVMGSMRLLGVSLAEYEKSPLLFWIVNVVVSNLVLIPLALLLQPVLRPERESDLRYTAGMAGMLVSLFVSVTIMMDFVFLSFSEDKRRVLAFLCVAAALLVCAVLLLLWLLKKMVCIAQMEQKSRIEENEYRFTEERQKRASQYRKETDALEQRMSSQLKQFSVWIQAGNVSAVLSEIGRLVADEQKIRRPRVHADPLADYLLSGLEKRCAKAGIRLEEEVDFPSSDGIEDVDLCTILSNIMDNAVKAACGAEESRREIHLKLHRNGDILFIGCGNSKVPDASGKMNLHPPGHFGLSNIRDTVSKYGGDVQVEDRSDTFQIQILLYCRGPAGLSG